MQRAFLTGITAVLLAASGAVAQDTPAAEWTRTKLLKAKVTAEFRGAALRDVLKDLAHQAEEAAGKPVMWTYGPEVPAGAPVTYACTGKPLDAVLDEVCKKAGLGYVVISDQEDRRDGWVRVTMGTERGVTKAAPNKPKTPDAKLPDADDDETAAAERVALAKKLVENKKPEQAKTVLTLVTKKYAATKAGAEAKDLLEKLGK